MLHQNGAGKVAEVLSRIRISDVCRTLTSTEPRRTGPDTWRARATWRGGDGFNVSIDDRRGVWHDFTTDEGGGVLDLVVLTKGVSRQDALRWVADFVGVSLDDKPIPQADRVRWAQERRELARLLPEARLWRRMAVIMTEAVLDAAKASLFDPAPSGDPRADISELPRLTRELARLERLDGTELVNEYGWWREHHPKMAAAMVCTARARERAERRALMQYLRFPEPERRTA